MADEQAWVIERADSAVSGPDYLCFRGTYGNSIHGCEGWFDWFKQHYHAIRFARKEDAEKFVGAILSISDTLPHNKTLRGLRHGDPLPRVCQHMWSVVKFEDVRNEE